MNDAIAAIAAIVALGFTVAIVAVLVSKSANTSGVIQASSTGISSIIAAAVAPVTGGGGNQAQGMTPTGSNLSWG